MKGELVIIRGLPGSGKSTMAREKYADHLHYEPDHLFCDCNGVYSFDSQLMPYAIDWVLKITDVALSRNQKVVVSDVFPTAESIWPFIRVAQEHGSAISVIIARGNFKNSHRVPVFVREKMLAEFEDKEIESFYSMCNRCSNWNNGFCSEHEKQVSPLYTCSFFNSDNGG